MGEVPRTKFALGYMMQKYCRKAAPSKASFAGKQSCTWKRMAKAGGKIHEYIHWALGEGEIHFWEDIWWRDKPISDMCNPRSILPQHRVKYFWQNGAWNIPLLRGVFGPLGVPREVIDEISEIPIEEGGKDILRWTCSNQGDFTTRSAWELCRHRRPLMTVFKLVWNDHTLPSISIFIWRLLTNRIPVDAKLQWRHISLASKCRCCRMPGVETREHLFLQGEIAREVWEKVASWFPSLPKWNIRIIDLERRIRF